MNNIETIQEQHTAGPIAIGFDYQFYYFLYLALDLDPNEKIGFEVFDDVHIELPNGKIELLQTKHTVQKKPDGSIVNLTERDVDLWKTINNWILIIQGSKSQDNFLDNTKFRLVTNKSIDQNPFLQNVLRFQKSEIKMTEFNNYLNNLLETTEGEIKKDIEKLCKLVDKQKKQFLTNIDIISNPESIIGLIKQRLYKQIRRENKIDLVYNALYANIQKDKFLTIENRQKFTITFEDFNTKYDSCFDLAYDISNLPRRDFTLLYPEDIKSQIFIRQLNDIGEMLTEDEMMNYTTKMLSFLNNIRSWIDEDHIVSRDDQVNLENEAIARWEVAFTTNYKKIKAKLINKPNSHTLESEINEIANDCIDEIRKEILKIKNFEIGTDFSNGQYYLLSNEPRIGWHYEWKKKYKQ
jgi:hypothetical protein